MSDEAHGPPRGEAAWKAAKQRIAANNDAAYARGRKERDAQDAEAQARRRAADKLDAKNVPRQPTSR
jgi:hypothetical protein